MPISKEEEQAAEEMIRALGQHKANIRRPVKVTPWLMDAFQKATRMRMTLNIDGKAIQIVEDEDASPDLNENIEAACEHEQLIQCAPCAECGGGTVMLEGGDAMCVRCRSVRPARAAVVDEAAEAAAAAALEAEREEMRKARTELTKHPSKRSRH